MAKRPTARLNDHHRAFLVREFACFSSPKEAADALRREFGVEIAPQSAQHYDAMSSTGSNAARKWQDLFHVSRQEFLNDFAKRVPEAYKAVRVRKLAKASRVFEANKNYMAMARMLEQIAKECGGSYTNHRQYTGRHGGPIKAEVSVSDMSIEEIDARLAELLSETYSTSD